jgi:NADH-quinone oxidoreductase subunit J
MPIVFYIAAAVAIIATCRVITALNAVHALLYLIVSLLAVALIFFALGAPFVAALEVIIYAGAIMVLFVFVIMMLNLGPQATAQERQWLQPKMWRGPAILAMVLIGELIDVLANSGRQASGASVVEPKQVGIALFGPYLLGVDLASLLLLAGLVGAYHLGRRESPREAAFGRRPRAEAASGRSRRPSPAPALSSSDVQQSTSSADAVRVEVQPDARG